MKYFVIFLILILTIATIPSFTNNVYAQCMAENEIDWNAALDESELVFVGGVIDINHVPNTQQIDFKIFEVIKGDIPLGEGYLYKNLGVSKSGNSYMSSSVSVEYEIGKIYKVYVHNGHTDICTTKIIGKMAPFEGIETQPVNSAIQSGQDIEVNYFDFRDASGEIICKGYSSGGGFFEYPECGPIDQFVIHVLVIVLPVAGIVSGFIIWRKRK